MKYTLHSCYFLQIQTIVECQHFFCKWFIFFIEFLKNETVIDNLVSTLLEYQEGMYEENHTLSLLLREKAQHETALNNIVSAIEQGIVNNTTGRRMKELEKQLLILEEKIIREKGKLNEKVP